MRYFLLVLMMICCNLYASDMFPLKPDENPRGAIALTLRGEVGLLNARFDIKRIEINETRELAYFCGLLKDTDGQYIKDEDDKYYLFDRILLDSGTEGWVSTVYLDEEFSAPEQAKCHFAGNVDLKSQELRALVKQYGRIAACLPVEKGDPLRTQLLDAVRENYVGDLNRKTTLNNTPVPSFVVTQLCAAQKYAYFCGEPANADADWYSQDSKKLDVVLVLQKDANNTWWLPVPQFQGISRQSSLAWCNHSTDILPVKTVEEMAKKRQQRCVREGDTVSLRGILAEQKSGAQRYWVVKLEEPLTCVQDADMQTADWNGQVQLLLSDEIIERVKVQYGDDLLNQEIVVTGDVLLALSSDHHTPLVLENIVELMPVMGGPGW